MRVEFDFNLGIGRKNAAARKQLFNSHSFVRVQRIAPDGEHAVFASTLHDLRKSFYAARASSGRARA